MSICPTFFALLLTSVFSLSPHCLIGGAWISLSLIGYIPGLEGKSIAEQILQF